MHVPTHLALSWLIGHRLRERRDRRLVAWAGIMPDLDALTLLAGPEAFRRYHHILTHGIVTGVIVTVLFTVLARERWKVAGLAFLTFHFHLFCDLLGAGRDWPIVYLYPFSRFEYFTPYGWPLASWQNVTITLVALVAIAWIGIKRGYSFAETFLPASADRTVVEILRRRFGRSTVVPRERTDDRPNSSRP